MMTELLLPEIASPATLSQNTFLRQQQVRAATEKQLNHLNMYYQNPSKVLTGMMNSRKTAENQKKCTTTAMLNQGKIDGRDIAKPTNEQKSQLLSLNGTPAENMDAVQKEMVVAALGHIYGITGYEQIAGKPQENAAIDGMLENHSSAQQVLQLYQQNGNKTEKEMVVAGAQLNSILEGVCAKEKGLMAKMKCAKEELERRKSEQAQENKAKEVIKSEQAQEGQKLDETSKQLDAEIAEQGQTEQNLDKTHAEQATVLEGKKAKTAREKAGLEADKAETAAEKAKLEAERKEALAKCLDAQKGLSEMAKKISGVDCDKYK